MTTTSHPPLTLEHRFADELPELVLPWQAAAMPAPVLLAANGELAEQLGLDATWLGSEDGIAALGGARPIPGSQPVAMAYAGHQFGGYSPRLGDGRALLLGELTDRDGRRRDLHLKGSGRTPFSRGGDGKAAVGPMLREYLIGEAMAGLDIPTTRALAVIGTGEQVVREVALPGAVLVRVAASHLRVGTFEYAVRLEDRGVLRRLADHAIARHHPDAAGAERPHLALLASVAAAQAALVARWLHVGFIHGVMNTDNMTISGETIDYGPCAFLDRFDPATVYSSIDHGGRYAFGNQPGIAQWNLTRFAETLLGLIDPDTDTAVGLATEVLNAVPDQFRTAWRAGMRAKTGLRDDRGEADAELFDALLAVLHEGRVDHTNGFRSLSAVLRQGRADAADAQLAVAPGFDAWVQRWTDRLAAEGVHPQERAAAMDRHNPRYIARNHLVEEALSAATAGDLGPFEAMLAVLRRPFEERPGLERYTEPRPDELPAYRTFCGT
ncbi:MAG: YdiU family protein [Acidimicrobiia bacterium]